MLTEVKLLTRFTNQRGILPELAAIHVQPNGRAWASDGDIELNVPTKLPVVKGKSWAVSAEVLGALLVAAGANSSIEIGDVEATVFSNDFTGKVPLERLAKPATSLVAAFDKAKTDGTWELAHPKAFTQALQVAAPFAADDPAVGLKWTAVVLNADSIFASNQGFGGVRIKLRHKIKFTDGKPGNDLAIPARAVSLLAELGEVVKFDVVSALGLGAFTFSNGARMVFRMLKVTTQDCLPIDRMNAVFDDMPDKAAWGLTAAPKVLVDRLTPLAAPKDGRIKLECDNDGWFMHTNYRSEVSVNLPQTFSPSLTAQAVTLSPKLWNLVLGAASEIAPDGDIRFRGGFTIDKSGFDLVGVMSGMGEETAAAPTEEVEEGQELPEGEPQ